MRPDSLHEAESRHSLTPGHFHELAGGAGGSGALEALAGAEFSHRLLLFDLLMDTLTRLAGVTAPLPEPQVAWNLLAAAQRHDPGTAVEDLLLLPETGIWLSGLLTRLRRPHRADTPLWVDAGHLHTLAAVAAIRAGLSFSLPVPARRGGVWLPTLGLARLPTAHRRPALWDTADVRSTGGRPSVTGRYGRLHLPGPPERNTPGWLPVRRVSLVPDRPPRVVLDDVGHHRIAPPPHGAARRLTPSAAGTWSRLLREAHALLADVDPPSAEAASVLMRSLQPIAAQEPFRVLSVTSGHGVGGMASSLPASVALCAATLVHELQHSKLSALMHLCPLYEPGVADRLYYAPWRDDPRPLGGMLQGAYAFMAVARFWQAYANRLPGGTREGAARFESALWLGRLDRIVAELSLDPALTEAGRSALETLLGTVRRLGAALGDGPGERLAHRMAADHRATWRLAHVRPLDGDVEALAIAWSGDRNRPPRLPTRRAALRDSGARHLDARAVLVRVGLADPAALDTLRDRSGDSVPGVAGAGRGDLLWACGDTAGARRLYAQDITTGAAGPRAWTGLGLALADTGAAPDAVAALTRVPELVAAVHAAVTDRSGRPPDPVALAQWLGRGTGRDPDTT
ncbi:aKG-HExxH-type peptide beta-hydroxylase [Streptomyces sp. NPDC016309]|uniref:aKG-HExxH-type peptide beta-hydroxylase n=1 Tax=Streptomyces sp. NPDC016309 TaxID=3364965 RepID=UPI0036F7ACB9